MYSALHLLLPPCFCWKTKKKRRLPVVCRQPGIGCAVSGQDEWPLTTRKTLDAASGEAVFLKKGAGTTCTQPSGSHGVESSSSALWPLAINWPFGASKAKNGAKRKPEGL